MTGLRAIAIRAAIVSAGAIGVAAGGIGAAQAQEQDIPRGWFKACTKQEDVDICNVQNIMVSDGGQLITGVSLIQVQGTANRELFQVTVPSGRMLPPGIGLQIDDGETQKLDYAVCMPDRCIAQAPLSQELVNSFKQGGEITLTSVNFQEQPNPINVTLEGFTDAYDGEPMQQSEIEDRQQQLQDFVSRNNEDFSRRLKEEQEKAKQGD